MEKLTIRTRVRYIENNSARRAIFVLGLPFMLSINLVLMVAWFPVRYIASQLHNVIIPMFKFWNEAEDEANPND